jgi:pimeloyl-ACP methyl ester carboxylesterase
MSQGFKSKSHLLLILSLILIIGGGFIAYLVQTGGGDIEIRDVRFMGSNGKLMSALLYIPDGVDAKNKAPGIVAIHGYINSRETQDGFAIEFSRRGYVVLAVDQTGHGFSDPPAFANGFGGIDALRYIRTLDMVDLDNIGLEGHSMGGWASAIAAKVIPNGYRSFVLASSSTGTYGAPEGTPTYPRNMALIFSKYDEFSGLMWGAPIPADIVKTDKLKKLFGTAETVEVGKLYGSIDDGTARKLYQPAMIHPRVHFSTEAIGNAIDWMQATLKGGNNRPSSDQTWYWKELFNLVALIGMIILLFPVGASLLKTNFFKELNETPVNPKSISGWGWWVSAVLMVIIPIIVYLWSWTIQGKGIAKPSIIWPQQITTVIMFWALVVALISLILFLLWHFISNKKKGAAMSDYGLTWKEQGVRWGRIGKSFLLAVIVVFAAYLSLIFSDWAFQTDFRIWVFAVKPMSALRFDALLGYLIPFTLYFLVLGIILHGQMRPGKADGPAPAAWKEMIINILLTITGFILFLLFQYLPLFRGGTLAIPEAHLAGIVLFQYIPIFIIVSLIATYFYRKTGHIYVGAFINGLLITWIIVAGQATHFAY